MTYCLTMTTLQSQNMSVQLGAVLKSRYHFRVYQDETSSPLSYFVYLSFDSTLSPTLRHILTISDYF